MAARQSFTARRLSVARAAWAISAASVLVGLGIVVAISSSWEAMAAPLVIPPLVLAAAFAAYAAPRSPAFAESHPVDVRIDAASVWLGKRVFISRDDVSQGFVVRSAEDEWMVRLERWGPRSDIRLVVKTVDEGRAILSALRLGVDEHTASFRGVARFHALSMPTRVAALAAPLIVQGALMAWAFAAETKAEMRAASLSQLAFLPAAIAFYAIVSATRTRIEVGSDGVLVRWLGRAHFHRHADIASIRAADALVLTAVHLELGSGRIVSLPMGTRRLDGARSRELAERIEEARARSTRVTARGAEGLDRRGRSGEAWLSALRNVGAGANADMRTAAVSLDDLAAVLLDPTSPPVARAAAAVAAVAADPFEGRMRIRVAQATCADEKLKRALGAILRFDIGDGKILKALGAIEAQAG